MNVEIFKANNSREIEFEAIAREHLDGVFVEQSPFLNARRVQIVQLAARYAIPADVARRKSGNLSKLNPNLVFEAANLIAPRPRPLYLMSKGD
jgi:hypothetical protein